MLKKILLVLVGIVLLALSAAGLLFWQRPESFPFLAASGCQYDSDLHSRFIRSYENADVDAIKAINDDIMSRSDYKNDLTCQYMLVRYSVLFESNEQIIVTYKYAKPLIENGKSVSPDLDDGVDHQAFFGDVARQVDYITDPDRNVDG